MTMASAPTDLWLTQLRPGSECELGRKLLSNFRFVTHSQLSQALGEALHRLGDRGHRACSSSARPAPMDPRKAGHLDLVDAARASPDRIHASILQGAAAFAHVPGGSAESCAWHEAGAEGRRRGPASAGRARRRQPSCADARIPGTGAHAPALPGDRGPRRPWAASWLRFGHRPAEPPVGLAAHAMGVNKAIGRDWMYRLQRLPWPAAFEMRV